MPRLLPVGFALLLAVADHAQQRPATAPLAPESLERAGLDLATYPTARTVALGGRATF